MAVKKKSGDDAGYKKFRADLAAGNLGSIYLFYGEEAYLRYFGRECNGRGIMELPETGNYEVEVIDTWEMTRDRVKSGVSGKVEVKLPGREPRLFFGAAEIRHSPFAGNG